jgi:rhamnosyl/mannosyltransferase
VLHVGKFYPPVQGGMEQVLASICAATRDRIESHIVVYNTTAKTVRETVDGVAVTRLGTVRGARSTPVAPGLPRELARAQADLIVLHEPNPWALVACALARPSQPLAIWFHSEVVRPRLQYALFYHPLVKRVYRRAARILVSSPRLAEHARALRPYRDRLAVVPFGIDAAAWGATPSRRERASALRQASGPRPLVLFTGRMVAYKGVDVLLRAIRDVDAFAVLAGDGPMRTTWMRLASELGLDRRVRFPGEVAREELAALYAAADVFVLPSVTAAEAFGFVQLEAMASGTPVISTRLPTGVPWVNQDGVTGLTVPPGDHHALAGALRTMLDDPQARARMAAAGRARVLDVFSLGVMGGAAALHFEQLAAAGAGQ